MAPAALVLGWAVVAFLAAVVAARVLAWDSRTILVGLNALTPVLFLPAWAVALGAAVGRRWRLAALSVVIVLAHVILVLPELTASTPLPASASEAPAFRVFDANILAGNADVAGYAREIRRAAPDLVVLEESSPAFGAALVDTGALRDLPYRTTVARADRFGLLLASRSPLTEDAVLYDGGRPIAVGVTTRIAGHDVRILAVHVVAPLGGDREAWVREIGMVRAAVQAERRPVLVAGDFNATWGHRAFRRLMDAGLTDAAAARGSPLQMTWPRNLPVGPALVRIDHVLTTAGLAVTHIRTGRGGGSDHRPLVAEVAVL